MGGAAWGGVFIFFLFVVGLNPIFNPTLYNPTKNVGYFLGFEGGGFATIEGGLAWSYQGWDAP